MAEEWIGCSSCSSVWLGDMANFTYFPNEPCPYCESVGHVGPVQGPSGADQEVADEMAENCCPRCGGHWATHRADGGDCPSSDAPTAIPVAKMLRRDLQQVLATLEDGDIGGAADQVRALIDRES